MAHEDDRADGIFGLGIVDRLQDLAEPKGPTSRRMLRRELQEAREDLENARRAVNAVEEIEGRVNVLKSTLGRGDPLIGPGKGLDKVESGLRNLRRNAVTKRSNAQARIERLEHRIRQLAQED